MEWLYTLLSVAIKAYCINCYTDSNSFILSQKGNWFSKINIKILNKLLIENLIYNNDMCVTFISFLRL